MQQEKAVGIEEELTQEENRFLEAAVKAIIRRVAGGGTRPSQTTKEDHAGGTSNTTPVTSSSDWRNVMESWFHWT